MMEKKVKVKMFMIKGLLLLGLMPFSILAMDKEEENRAVRALAAIVLRPDQRTNFDMDGLRRAVENGDALENVLRYEKAKQPIVEKRMRGQEPSEEEEKNEEDARRIMLDFAKKFGLDFSNLDFNYIVRNIEIMENIE